MEPSCKNCGNEVNGNYCNQCGQPAVIQRVNWHYITHGLIENLFHVEHGLWFTLREFSLRPGYAARDFIEGKRIAFLPAITYLATVSVVYFLFSKFFLPDTLVFDNRFAEVFTGFFREYYDKILLAAVIPFSVLYTKVFFPRIIYNFFELFVFYCYLRAQFLLIEMAVLLFDWLMVRFGIFLSYNFLKIAILILTVLYLIKAVQQLVDGMGYKRVWLRVLGMYACVIATAAVLGGLAGGIYALVTR